MVAVRSSSCSRGYCRSQARSSNSRGPGCLSLSHRDDAARRDRSSQGVFDWVAGIAVSHARGSAARLFLLIYLAGTIVTIFLSNDATAVVLTPAVLAAVRRARVQPRSYLLICALIANAASFVLPISNPANLVIFDAKMPPLPSWLRVFLLPSLVSVLATYLILYFLFRSEIANNIEDLPRSPALTETGKAALAGIALSAVVLLVASGLGWQLGAPTCAVGLLAVLIVSFRDRRAALTVVRGVSWSVVPLVAGLFMIVEALNRGGLLQMAERGLRWAAGLHTLAGKLAARVCCRPAIEWHEQPSRRPRERHCAAPRASQRCDPACGSDRR